MLERSALKIYPRKKERCGTYLIRRYSTDQKKPNRRTGTERIQNGYKNANGTGTERVQNGYRTEMERIQHGYESQKLKKAF